jgi:hypothetical protein
MTQNESDLIILRDAPRGSAELIGRKALAYRTIPVTREEVIKAGASLMEVFQFWSSRLGSESMSPVWRALCKEYENAPSNPEEANIKDMPGEPSEIHERSTGFLGFPDPAKFPLQYLLGGLGVVVGLYGWSKFRSTSKKRDVVRREFVRGRDYAQDVDYVVVEDQRGEQRAY